MLRLIEAIPNFSEGRDLDKIKRIVDSVAVVEGVKIIDYSSDSNHNRSVITIVGEVERVVEALKVLALKVFEEIDMTKHRGNHPRMGALDVVPLVPLKGISMEETIFYAKEVAEFIGNLGVPVFLYEKAATSQDRENLANVRKGEYEGFFEKIKGDSWKPDFGPDTMNPKTGACAVSARDFLIAFNVNLNTSDVDIAKKIAKNIRNLNGGLRYVKALGIYLEDRNIAQVSMNLVNFNETPIYRVLELVKIEANRYGVNVIGTELIGAMPIEAVRQSLEYYLQLETFNNNQILELNF